MIAIFEFEVESVFNDIFSLFEISCYYACYYLEVMILFQ